MIIILSIICAFIPLLLACGLMHIIDKLDIEQKVLNFDKKNSGPIYDTLKAFVAIIVFLVVIVSFGFAMFLPFTIYNTFITDGIVSGIITVLISTLVCTIVFYFLDKDGL